MYERFKFIIKYICIYLNKASSRAKKLRVYMEPTQFMQTQINQTSDKTVSCQFQAEDCIS